MSLKDQIEDARRAISGPVYYHYPPGASEALEVVCKSDYDALAARLAEAEAAAKTWENEAERRSRRYEKAAVQLAEAERRLDERPKTWWLPWTPLEAAQRMHDAYEQLAPHFGYTTRTDTRKFDPDSPNGQLMIATIRAVFIEQAAAETVTEGDK